MLYTTTVLNYFTNYESQQISLSSVWSLKVCWYAIFIYFIFALYTIFILTIFVIFSFYNLANYSNLPSFSPIFTCNFHSTAHGFTIACCCSTLEKLFGLPLLVPQLSYAYIMVPYGLLFMAIIISSYIAIEL